MAHDANETLRAPDPKRLVKAQVKPCMDRTYPYMRRRALPYSLSAGRLDDPSLSLCRL